MPLTARILVARLVSQHPMHNVYCRHALAPLRQQCQLPRRAARPAALAAVPVLAAATGAAVPAPPPPATPSWPVSLWGAAAGVATPGMRAHEAHSSDQTAGARGGTAAMPFLLPAPGMRCCVGSRFGTQCRAHTPPAFAFLPCHVFLLRGPGANLPEHWVTLPCCTTRSHLGWSGSHACARCVLSTLPPDGPPDRAATLAPRHAGRQARALPCGGGHRPGAPLPGTHPRGHQRAGLDAAVHFCQHHRRWGGVVGCVGVGVAWTWRGGCCRLCWL